MVWTKRAGASSEGRESIVFESDFGGLEEKYLLVLETLVNSSSIVLVLENHGCQSIFRGRTNVGLHIQSYWCPGW